MNSAKARPGGAGKYRKLLLAKRSELLAGLRNRPETLAKLGRMAEEDQAPITHEEFISVRINGITHGQLRLVDLALERLEAGDYGVCVDCETRIPDRRLQAVPWASRCVACQERLSVESEGEECAA